MRILHITEPSAAGVGRHVLDLSSGQARMGLDVEVIHSTVRVDKPFQIRKSEYERQGLLRFHEIPMQLMPAIGDAAVVKQLRNIITSRGPFDIIHSHSTKAGLVGRLGVVGLKNAGARVYTPHAPLTMDYSRGNKFRRGVRLYERFMGGLGHIIAVSSEEAEHIVAHIGIDRERVTVIPNGIDLTKFDKYAAERNTLRQQYGIAPDVFCIGFIGRLSFQKNPEAMIRIFDDFRKVMPGQSVLMMAGEGPLGATIDSMVRERGIADLFRQVGADVEGRRLMAAFDVFVMTSRYEGLPYVLLEAAASGLPILASKTSGAAGLVEPDINGWAFPFEAEKEFVSALAQIARDASLRTRFARASRTIAESNTVELMVEKTVNLYQLLIKGSN